MRKIILGKEAILLVAFAVLINFVAVISAPLHLTHPNGGEEFAVGSDAIITWEGVLPSDTVKLEYSYDNGDNWSLITDKATNLSYKWANIPPPISKQCLAKASIGSSAEGGLQWQKCFGGSGTDWAGSIIQTLDGGYIIAGYTSSTDGDVSGNHGDHDAWVVKMDDVGSLQWQKCFGGSSYEIAGSIIQTLDGGYIIAGHTISTDGDVSGNHGGHDAWVVKMDAVGTPQWQKCFGGSSYEIAGSIIQTLDGGYIIAGQTTSTDGDVSGNHGDHDSWVVKMDAVGTLQWQKCFGGSHCEIAGSIIQTLDGGYIIAGYATSTDGDVSGNHGESDAWVIKLSPDYVPTQSDVSDAIFSIFATNPIIELKTIDMSAYPSDSISIPIILNNEFSLDGSGASHINTDLTFNPTLLYPLNHSFTTENEKTARITLENLPIDKQVGDTLATIDFIVGLGNATECDLLLENPEAIGDEVDITVVNGHFTLLGICEEGGTRLINPTGEAAGIISINPNPATEEVNIKLNFIETGKAEVAIYNYMGEKISTIFSEEISAPREQEIKVSVSDYNSGLYFIIFESATIRETKEVLIVR